jgi:hypothetical protein
MEPPPGGRLARIRARLSRRLWAVDEEFGARQRLRLMVGMPFAAIAGLAWGVFAAPSLVGGVPFWAAVGSASFSLFMYVQQRLIGPVGRLVDHLLPRAGGLAGLAWEGLSVGALLLLLTRGLGAPLVPAVGTALGLGAFYLVVSEYLIHGGAGSHLALLFQGGASGSGRRGREGFSYAESLVMRGRVDEAIEVYRDAIARDPKRVAPYLRLSALRVGEGAFEEGVRVLRAARDRARLGREEEAVVVRRIHAICERHLGAPEHAREDLEWLVERQRMSEQAAWARRELRALRGSGSTT